MNITKEHIGKTIYGVPTVGHSIRRRTKPYDEFKVIKVARVYMTLEQDGRTDEYRIDNGCDKRSHQSGYFGTSYKWHESKEEIEREFERVKAIGFIRDAIGSYGPLTSLDYDDIMAIKAIMDTASERNSTS